MNHLLNIDWQLGFQRGVNGHSLIVPSDVNETLYRNGWLIGWAVRDMALSSDKLRALAQERTGPINWPNWDEPSRRSKNPNGNQAL
jgi:hypothetical protein